MLARRAATGTLPSVQRFLCTSAFPNSLRGIPAQQVDVSLSPDPSGLSFAHHCRPNRAVDSELAAPHIRAEGHQSMGITWLARPGVVVQRQ